MCQVTGKKPLTGNKVSHSHRKTKRVQKPNLLKKRIYIPEDNRTITVKLSARALRSMNRKGVKQVLKEHGFIL
jgi:large subunit ribosomal protein L28